MSAWEEETIVEEDICLLCGCASVGWAMKDCPCPCRWDGKGTP